MNEYWIAMVTFYAFPCPMALEAEQSSCLGAGNTGRSANSIATGMEKKNLYKMGPDAFLQKYRSFSIFMVAEIAL